MCPLLTTTTLPALDLTLERNGEPCAYETHWEADERFQYKRLPMRYARAEASEDDVWSITASGGAASWKVLPEKAVEIIEATNGQIRFRLAHAVEQPTHLAILSGPERLLYLFLDPPNYQPIPEGAIDITSLGIEPGGDALVCGAINAELVKLSQNGGGALHFPAGVYPIATIFMQDNTTLHLDEGAVLLGSLDIDAYPLDPPGRENMDLPRSLRPGNKRRLIYLDQVDNAAILGKGTVDGQGSEWRRLTMPGERPYMNHVRMVESRNITLEGIILRDSEFWSTHLLLCDNIRFDGIKIVNEFPPHRWDRFLRPKSESRWNNADGINPDSSQDVHITNVFFHTGDDCIPIKNTSSYKGKLRDVRNISARSCMMTTPVTAMKLGTETLGEYMENIIFEDIEVVYASRVISTDLKDGLTAANIIYRDIRVFECNRPFDFWLIPRGDHPEKTEFSNLRNVLLEDITIADYAIDNDGGEVAHILGRDPEHTVENILFRNMVIEGRTLKDFEFPVMETNEYSKNIHFE